MRPPLSSSAVGVDSQTIVAFSEAVSDKVLGLSENDRFSRGFFGERVDCDSAHIAATDTPFS